MSSFPQFANLPLELQREVWQASLDEAPEPGVHIIRHEDNTNGDPGLVTMDIGCNSLMHVCRESRAMARKQLKFRHVDRGACLNPYRAFNLDTDAIYVSVRDLEHFFDEESFASWTVPPANLRHLALDARTVNGVVERVVDYLGILRGLQTVSIVFSEEGWVPRDHVPTGDLPYQLLDFAVGDLVWYAPSDRVKKENMDPWEVTKTVRRRFAVAFCYAYSLGEIPDLEHAPYDKSTGELLFDIVPQRMVPKLPGRRVEKQRNLLSSFIRGLRGLMPSHSR
ncbi:hypothetical protein F5883DRAFT_577884 [Diaporthe sp. PMI_573]|nr:hypothetical protein F5883DRAFT_577884 [Diaporthaceae sp. PMI_573]